jgi:transposase
VAIDLHRWRSVIVREDEGGRELGVTRIDNSPLALSQAVGEAGPCPQVAIEATAGWYWAVDVLHELGAEVHLVNPSGLAWGDRRVKNDYRDCCDLIERMRLGKLPEAWIAPPATRELRELVRFRHKLMQMRTSLKAQVKAVVAKHGLRPPVADLWGPGGTAYLNSLELPDAYHIKVESLRDLVAGANREIETLEGVIHRRLVDDPGYWAIQAIHGVGRVLAAVFVAEIGDVSRFPTPGSLCSWAGLTPRHRESDTKLQRGHITKAGSPLVRWAAVEAISRIRGGPKLQADYHRHRRSTGSQDRPGGGGPQVAHLVYFGLRDGEIRCLTQPEAA